MTPLQRRLREWPKEYGLMTPELACELADLIEAAEDLVQNIREHGSHDNYKALAAAIERTMEKYPCQQSPKM